MKKILSCLLLSLSMIAFVACGGGSSSSSDKMVLTYAENHPDNYPTTMAAYKFAQDVSNATGGRIIIEVHANAVLGDSKTIVEGLEFGGIAFSRISLSPLAEFVPQLDVLQLPYLYNDAEHMWSVLEGSVGEQMLAYFDNTRLVPLSWFDGGARNFYNSVRPVKTLEDMKGLNIRVQESQLMMKMIESLGANPSVLAYGDVYSGLQTGIIDGAENNWPSYESTSHYEVAPYMTIDEHTRVPELQLVSRMVWDKLSDADKEIIRKAAIESALYERELWAQTEKEAEAKVVAGGVQVEVLSAAEKAKFQQAVAPMYQQFGGEYQPIIDAIIAEGKK